jgi:nitrate reductase NapE component
MPKNIIKVLAEEHGNSSMFRLLDTITSGVILFIVIVLNVHMLERLGGSAILLTVCAFVYYLSYSHKKVQLELSIIVVLTLTLVGLNYVAYIESEKICPFSYILGVFGILALLIIIFFLILNIRAIRVKNDETVRFQPNKMEIAKRVTHRISIFPILSLGFVIPSGFGFIIKPDSEIIRHGWIKYTPLAVFWLMAFFVIAFLNLKTIHENYMVCLLGEKQKLNIRNLKNNFLIGTLIVFVLGSGMEFSRGFWVLWIETVLLFALIILASWTIWKYLLEDSGYDIECDIEGISLEGLPSFASNFGYFIKYFAAYVLLGTFYLGGLVLIFSFY